MRQQLERLRRGLWVIKQPLTKRPDASGAPVSDLFVWRNSEDWKSYFELTDLPGLFKDHEKIPERYVTFFFFDNKGKLFLEKQLALIPNRRQTVDLSAFLANIGCSFGTFSVFHSDVPEAVTKVGSFIAERGYVSYCYKEAPLRSYVHGNLDAIALRPDKSMQLLGSGSFLPREYRMQHELVSPSFYELGIVNPTANNQRFSCTVFSNDNGEAIDTQAVRLAPRGTHIFAVRLKQAQTARIVINSRLVMARPLVFHIYNQKMDVFHG